MVLEQMGPIAKAFKGMGTADGSHPVIEDWEVGDTVSSADVVASSSATPATMAVREQQKQLVKQHALVEFSHLVKTIKNSQKQLEKKWKVKKIKALL